MSRIVVAAAALSCLAASALAAELPLPNGSFESGSPADGSFGPIAGWTTSEPAGEFASGVFTSYAGYAPSSGNRMALITNEGASSVTLRTLSPVALLGRRSFGFSFAFLTSDAAMTPVAARDQFQVVIDYFSDAAGMHQIGSQVVTIDTGMLGAVGGPMAAGQPWAAGTTINGTRTGSLGALTPTSILLDLASAPYAHFSFYLDNLGVGGPGSVSGAIIDSAYVNPEPGTLALFGLGAAGLGAAVWRRRKNAKKPAAN